MSKNIPKKLELKTELLLHLDTAMTMVNEGKSSSKVKLSTLYLDIRRVDKGKEPLFTPDMWKAWLEEDA